MPDMSKQEKSPTQPTSLEVANQMANRWFAPMASDLEKVQGVPPKSVGDALDTLWALGVMVGRITHYGEKLDDEFNLQTKAPEGGSFLRAAWAYERHRLAEEERAGNPDPIGAVLRKAPFRKG